MRIDHPGRDTRQGPADWFTGTVWMDELAVPSPSRPVAMYSVHFLPGGRTAWHAHPAGQVLHVTEGSGFVQSKGGPAEVIRAGDTVVAEPGEWHWHGAGPRTFMTHLAVQEAVDGSTADWGDHVGEDEYPS